MHSNNSKRKFPNNLEQLDGNREFLKQLNQHSLQAIPSISSDSSKSSVKNVCTTADQNSLQFSNSSCQQNFCSSENLTPQFQSERKIRRQILGEPKFQTSLFSALNFLSIFALILLHSFTVLAANNDHFPNRISPANVDANERKNSPPSALPLVAPPTVINDEQHKDEAVVAEQKAKNRLTPNYIQRIRQLRAEVLQNNGRTTNHPSTKLIELAERPQNGRKEKTKRTTANKPKR